MSEEVVKEVKVEEFEEEIQNSSFSIDVKEGSPQKIDFSKGPKLENKDDLLTAKVVLVNRNEEDDKGVLTLKVSYLDVADINDADEAPIVKKEDVVAKFEEGDYEQKQVEYTFTDENEATFSVEGSGSCTIVGFFTALDDEEEEEEEEANDEDDGENEKKEE